MTKHHCETFRQVLEHEVNGPIQERRSHWNEAARAKNLEEHYPSSDGKDLVGVALSGGGIRSSMFNLGLLQAFKQSGLMKHVDFLSSVSGGGYTNGYYSTLGHFDHTAEKTTSTNTANDSMSTEGLSARDAQFLLDGQYLNRPIEFLTDYLLKTSVIFFTAFAGLIAVSSLIALYFRFFDYPDVRRWLGLLDLSSDLRVGVFASFVLAVIVLCSRLIIRKLASSFGRPMQQAPGQWAVLTLAIFLLGISIMIGNGDFYVSNGLGFLPEKLDLKSLQLPILVFSLLLFSPMLRFGKLLQSEKVNASIWQKLALWVVLFGTSWGVVLGIVGWIGRENISGFIDNRPPKLVKEDILSYGELALLLEARGSKQIGRLRELVVEDLGTTKYPRPDNPSQVVQKEDFDRLISEVCGLQKTTNLAQSDLRQEDFEWDSWSNFSSQALSRWTSTITSRLSRSPSSSVTKFVEADARLHQKGWELSSYVDRLIDSTRADMDKNAKNWQELSNSLLEQAVLRISSVSSTGTTPIATAQEKAEQEIVSIPKVIEWIVAGGKMVRKDRKPYKDLSTFNTLFRKCLITPDKFSIEALSNLELWQLNRMFLEIAYPTIFKERAMISTSVVVYADQEFRFAILLLTASIALVGFCVLDLNKLSPWFLFYRRRVRETFLQKAHRDGAQPLKNLNPTKNGFPYPLFVSAMILPQAPSYHRSPKLRSKHANPSKLDESFASNWYSFVLSPLYCGWLPTGKNNKNSGLETYRSTQEYLNGNLGVDDAVVLSGAAMTPFMATNSSLKVLMHLFNIRLEQWLPNPRAVEQPSELAFSLVDLGHEWKSQARWGADSWRYGVVADGGFREFLGVEELVARRCRILIVSDAGCNNGLYEFGVLAELIRKLRLDHSIEVLDLDHDRPMDTRRLKRIDKLDSRSPQHFVLGRIRYPEKFNPKNDLDSKDTPQQDALLVYVQMSLTGDEDIDIEQFRRTNPHFPDEPISNQFYSSDQVESFRQLGEHIGRLLCRDVDPYDVPTMVNRNGKSVTLTEDESRDYRVRQLEDAFCSTYRNECRQESTIATDDAGIGWMMNVDHIQPATLQRVHRYEKNSEHQLLIRDYVWNCLEDFESDRAKHFDQINYADLYGIAIECNRRHAGFRPEWPTSFFQIAGRDLLIRASQLALDLQNDAKASKMFYEYMLNPQLTSTPPQMIKSLGRLSVMLPRGVFRLCGSKTAAEILVCLVGHIVRIQEVKAWDSLDWLLCEKSQKRLRFAIETGRAKEVEQVLIKLIRERYQSEATTTSSSKLNPEANLNSINE